MDDPASEQPTNEMVAVPRTGAVQIGELADPFANTVYGGFAHRSHELPVAPALADPPRPPSPDAPHQQVHVHPQHTPSPLWPAPGQSRRRAGRWLPLVAVCCGFCVVAVLITGALASSGQWLNGIASSVRSIPTHARVSPRTPVASSATAQATGACPRPTVDAHAASMLQLVQLATGIQSPQSDIPIDQVTAFHVGQTIYVAFEVNTNASGVLAGTICTNGIEAAKTLQVPAGQLHRRGEFNLPSSLTPAQVGPGTAVLTWNGAVAATLAFTVTAR